MKYYISPPPLSPLARIITSAVAVLVIAAAILFGLFLLAGALGLGLLAWLGLAIRGWWLRRKGPGEPSGAQASNAEVIEAEYTVISRRRD